MRDIAKEAPDFINDEGVKWWHESDLTRYAFRKGFVGVRVWTVERPDGHKTRLFADGETILADDQTAEGLCIKIDLMAFARQSPNANVTGLAPAQETTK